MTGNTDTHLLVTDTLKVEAWIRTPVSIWCDYNLPHAAQPISFRVDQAVDCGLWNVVPLLFNSCAKLLDIGENWDTIQFFILPLFNQVG